MLVLPGEGEDQTLLFTDIIQKYILIDNVEDCFRLTTDACTLCTFCKLESRDEEDLLLCVF